VLELLRSSFGYVSGVFHECVCVSERGASRHNAVEIIMTEDLKNKRS